ncbi:Tetratricopeptide repeat protein 34 [Pteropus alecto]|uniref:Tetratricopeptide repeat protein 34 n=1 Tax=Pteropus alecto TaxID=9402 RepID=L5KIK9_PTEAL|nr:Tetratricopeptide repeat protein 34 [Pteropus alecto]
MPEPWARCLLSSVVAVRDSSGEPLSARQTPWAEEGAGGPGWAEAVFATVPRARAALGGRAGREDGRDSSSSEGPVGETAAQEAGTLLSSGQPWQALGYCSLAVLASGGRAGHLRLRATCLAELQEFGRALGDLDRVLQEDAGDCDLRTRVEDLCSRGRLLLSLGDEAGATGALAQALRLAPTTAQSSLWEQPGRARAARIFLCQGQRCLQEQRYTEAWTAAESGLLVDPEHGGLKRLKARIRREATSGCRLH